MWRTLALAWLLLPAPATASQHGHALLVGIERYPEQLGWPRLRGPRADVRAVREALIARAGFASERIAVLLDEQATRDAILGAFLAMARRAGPEDVLLLYFAGHGSQLRDDDGDELDGLDETLVPYDAAPIGQAPRDLRDDDLKAAIAAANAVTPHVVLIFDCCSAGTNTRGTISAMRRVPFHTRGLGGVRQSASVRQEDSGYLEPGPSYVALAACRAHEPAYEIEVPGEGPAQHRGLFTHCLLAELEHGVGAVSYDQLLASVRRRVRRLRPEQTPVIEGPLRTSILFAHGLPARPAAYSLSAGQARLQAGRANGVRAGAVLAVASARDPAGSELGRIRLEDVGATSSSFTWIGEPAAASSALVAHLLDPSPDQAFLRVALQGEDPVLSAQLLRLRRVRLVGADEAELLLRREGERWSCLTAAGEALPLGAAVGQAGEIACLCTGLERLGTARAIEAGVRREGTGAGLIEATVERLDDQDSPLGPLQRDPGGVPTVQPGDVIGVKLTNRAPFAVYASLLVISPDGSVLLAHAPENEDDLLPPGGTLRTVPLEVFVDGENAPFYRGGFDCLRWVVTRRFHDLRDLQQPAATDATVQRGGEPPDPEAARLGLAHEDGWLTCSTEIRVLRN